MNLHLCRIALRPRGPLEVFDLVFALLRAHPGLYARLTAVCVGPLAMVCAVGVVLTEGDVMWLAAPPLLAPFIGLPFTLLTGRVLFADSWTVRMVLRELLGSFGRLVTVLVISLGIDLAGFLFCFAGLMFSRPLGAFLAEAALLERTPMSRVLSRSTRLALLHPAGALAVAGAWFVLTAWAMAAGEAVGQAFVGMMLQLGQPFGSVFEDGVVTPYVVIGGLLVQPVFAVYRVLQFVDVRTRIDGWDLQVGLRAAGINAARESA